MNLSQEDKIFVRYQISPIFVSISEYRSIINNVFNPHASPLNHSSYANIEVSDNAVTHIQWNPPNFLTNVRIQSLYCQWIVGMDSFLQITPKEVISWGKIRAVCRPWVVGSTRDKPVPREIPPEVFQ